MPSSGWIITGQVPDQYSAGAGGQPVLGVYVYFTTSDGNPGSVFVPDEHYTTANVRQMVEAKANVIDSVGAQAERYRAPE